MLLKMNTGLGGPDFNLVRDDEHDFADPFEARRLVRAGFATPANEAAQAELDALPEDEPADGGDREAAAKAEADAAAEAAAKADAEAAAKAEADSADAAAAAAAAAAKAKPVAKAKSKG